MRPLLGLVIGLLVGAIGAVLFVQSLPPKKGSIEERAERAEFELQKMKTEWAALEAKSDPNRQKIRSRNAAESIAHQLRSGRKVSIDDVYVSTMKPWMRNIGPLFDRGRVVSQKKRFDRLTGELTRKYDLDDRQQEKLRRWLDRKAEENGHAISSVLENPSSGFVDFAKAMDEHESSYKSREGLDEFMAETLDADTLTSYQIDRMTERVNRVQNEAEGKVQRLDSIVDLDEDQKDEIFALMARSSEAFDPSMQFEGLEADTTNLDSGAGRDAAIRAVLRPDQRAQLEERRQERLEDARREFEEIGLLPPKGWERLESTAY